MFGPLWQKFIRIGGESRPCPIFRLLELSARLRLIQTVFFAERCSYRVFT